MARSVKTRGTTHAHVDYFRADKAWVYIVLLTIGYMVSRGLAKFRQPRALQRLLRHAARDVSDRGIAR